mmetsp:Transcript_60090/g.143190  ORF Transcript_60090/g.143190 Transcript_60090/m.143190 type:complete len:359 (+) Transcript_60090:98-1174(+)
MFRRHSGGAAGLRPARFDDQQAEWASLSSEGILDGISQALPVADIARLGQTASQNMQLCRELRHKVLQERGYEQTWTWQQANTVETALFLDRFSNLGNWAPGPNEKSPCNVMESSMDSSTSAEWLLISGGTDWQGFQGGFRQLSEVGLRPRWISFQVRITTPELSGAFLALAPSTHTWGLSEPVLSFSYGGDERSQQRRCFSVQTGAIQSGGVSHSFCPDPEVVRDRPYAIAVELDWRRQCMSVYVDGMKHIHQVPFQPKGPIRFAAVYNWRSRARTAFSQLVLGNARPHPVKQADADGGGFASSGPKALMRVCPCRKRRKHPLAETSALQPIQWLRAQVITPAVILLAAALHFASQA